MRAAPLISSARGHLILLLACWLLHLAFNAAFLSTDRSGPHGFDAANHLDLVYQFKEGITFGGAAAAWQEFRGTHHLVWPPLAHLILGSTAALFDGSMSAVRLYNLLFLAVLMGGVYWIGGICHSRRAGLLAALCTSFTPAIYGASRDFGIDLPCAAMVAVSLGALLSTRGFANTRRSLLFGALVGLAILARGQSLFFLSLPAMITAGRGMTRGGWRSTGNALLALATALIISAAWWYGKVSLLLEELSWHFNDPSLTPAVAMPREVVGGWQLYLGWLPLLYTLPLVLACAALLPAWVRARHKARYELAAWILFPLALHLVMAHQNVTSRQLRYLLPLAPALLLMASIGALSLRRTVLCRACITLLLVAAILPFLICNSLNGKYALPRRALCSMPDVLCGDRTINHETATSPFHSAARRLAKVIVSGERRGQRSLLMVDPLADRAQALRLADLVSLLRSHLSRAVLWPATTPPLPWQRRADREIPRRYLLSLRAAAPTPEVQELVAKIRLDPSEGQAGALLGAQEAKLWRMKPGSCWLP